MGHPALDRTGARDRVAPAHWRRLCHPPHARPPTTRRHHPLGHPGHHPPSHPPGSPRTLSLDALDAALAEALVRKLVTLETLESRATGKLKYLLDTAAPTKSKLERDLRRLLRDHGLPQPVSNGIVEGFEVDLHWPDLMLVAELDGYAFHAHRRAFETDRERDIVLAAAGWRTVRVTDRQLNETRATTAERFTALLLSSRAC